MMITFEECFKNIKTMAISGHVHPDGDCIGSCLGLYNYVQTYHPEIAVSVYLEPIPRKFRFLKNADQIRRAKEEEELSFDLFVALDCGSADRLGDAARFFETAKKTLCVDHHVTNDSFADVNEIHPKASSASELVYRMLPAECITTEIAECLYMGIAHDTGVFQYSNTSSQTMQIAGVLMDTGIDYPRIIDETYYVRSFAQQKVWGKAFQESSLHMGGKCIYSMLTKADRDAYGASPGAVDGIVSQLRSTAGVEVSVFLYELEDGWKISLRSASYVDVAKMAQLVGGGGHARAAGASVKGNPEEIKKALFHEIKKQL